MSKRLTATLFLILALCGYTVKVWITPAPNSSPAQHTQPVDVAQYLLQHHKLPEFYIHKHSAHRRGWVATKGNLCDVLPGRVIGGDVFYNREHRLPAAAGRNWYEADVNFRCDRRNGDRLLYSSDGLVYLTTDHYHSFKRLP